MKVLAPINLTLLGTKLMTVTKCLTSKDEKTSETKVVVFCLEQCVCACLSLGSAWECGE
jgi:hypothetical protein